MATRLRETLRPRHRRYSVLMDIMDGTWVKQRVAGIEDWVLSQHQSM